MCLRSKMQEVKPANNQSMTYRKAKPNEAEAIAILHAQSWQVAYKGILSDAFLRDEVLDNRLKLWQTRFYNPPNNVFICVAVDENDLKGFVCIYGNDDAQWGSLIDNLHVLPNLKGQGIGKTLMQKAVEWASKNYPNTGLYLWVYEDNVASLRFYEKMGGENVETQLYENADGSSSNIMRYAWQNLDTFIQNN
jgi:ribosomal protein S18 acetylase RimI-like enzyme